MRAVAHWDDIATETEALGPIGGTWQELGGAAGAVRLGVNRSQLPAGQASSPLHAEDEEVFYVLGGSGWSVQEDGCFAIAAGDVVHYGAWQPAHTVVAGEDGIDILTRGTVDLAWGGVRFPRLGKVKVHEHLLEGDRTHQWELEALLLPIEIPETPDPRPETIVNVADVEPVAFGGTQAYFIARRLGMRGIALNYGVLGPGAEAAPLHCHSAEEECFVVLEGDGVLLLGSDEEEHAVSAGSVISRPAGTGVAHAFRGGEQGMTMLMFSDKHANDMAFYPRTGKVTLRGLGVTFKPNIVPWAD
jgi:uncharacterized cupin superfamily protein